MSKMTADREGRRKVRWASALRMTVWLSAPVPLAAGTLQAGDDFPEVRPIVQIVLSRDGSLVEGTLVRFEDGVYMLKVKDGMRSVKEADIRSIRFRWPAAAREESEIDQLIAELAKAGRASKSVPAATTTALARKGECAIEPLLAAVAKDSQIYQAVGDVLRQMDANVRPKLLDAIRHDGGSVAQLAVGWMFAKEGVAAAGTLMELLDEPDPSLRLFALDTLYGIGTQAGNELPASLAEKLIRTIRDRDPKVQAKAVEVLSRIDPAAEAVLPALLREVEKHAEPSTRYQIVLALGNLQQNLKPDDPRLGQLLDALSTAVTKDAAESVRATAATELAYMGRRAAPALPAVRKALDDPSAEVRHYARQAQDFITTNQTDPMRLRHYNPRLAEEKDPNGPSLAGALAGLDEPNAALVRQLCGAGEAGANEARRRLAAAPPSGPLVAALAAAVRADDHNEYWPQVSRLMADWDEKALPHHDRFARDEHWRVRRTAAVAWGRMPLKTLPKAFEALVGDKEVLVRLSAAQSLESLSRGGSADLVRSASALLIRSMKDEDIQIAGWWRGASALANLAPACPEAIDALIQSLDSAKREMLRAEAAQSLGLVGRKLPEEDNNVARTVEALTSRISRESDPYARRAVLSALGGMGKRAASASTELRKATDDPTESIARAAREALEKVKQ